MVCDDVTYAYVVAGVAIAATAVEKLPVEWGSCVEDPAARELLSKAWVLLFDPHSCGHVVLEDYVAGTAARFASRSPANKIVPGGARWVPCVPLLWHRARWMVTMPQRRVVVEGGSTILET